MSQTSAQRSAWGKALVLGFLLAALIAASLTPAASPAHAQTTFIVNKTTDEGDANFADGRCDTEPATSGNQCTLRAAIDQANETTGADAIHFDVGGSRVKTIRPTSELSTIFEAVTIDGYTQPGTKKNTLIKGSNAVPLVEISGTSADNASGLRIFASNVVVMGLVINGFGDRGIFTAGANTRIEGNFIGTDASETLDRSLQVEGIAVTGLNVTVGGSTPETRNLVSGNSLANIAVADSGAKVQGNLIGTKKDGATDLGTDGTGLLVSGDDNRVGGTSPGEANTFAFGEGEGILLRTGTGNHVLSNSGLGIDLEGGISSSDGATANDPGDADTGPSNMQNKPAITSAKTSATGVTTIKGKLNSIPNKTFRVQFFSSPSGNEGRKFIGQKIITTDADGIVPFTFSPADAVAVEQRITATATGAGDTSEFSAPRTVLDQ